ncbi:Os04g0170166, partial [Oryza sativa Japonica Group]
RGGGGERSVVLVVGIVAVQPCPPANAKQARATGGGGGEFGRSAVEAEAERVLGSPQPCVLSSAHGERGKEGEKKKH